MVGVRVSEWDRVLVRFQVLSGKGELLVLSFRLNHRSQVARALSGGPVIPGSMSGVPSR